MDSISPERTTDKSSKSTPTTVVDVRERLKNLFIQQKHTDCSFRIDGKIIHSHKLILSSASPVFEAMFFGPLAETKKCIEITDINSDIFQMMLHYIYTDEIDKSTTSIEDFLELYYCADKYLINELLQKCDRLIKVSLRHSNILRALDLAVSMDVSALLTICVNFFIKFCLVSNHFLQIIQQNDYHISKECLNYILNCKIKHQNINLICLIREWCKTEADHLNLLSADDIKLTLSDIELPADLMEMVKDIQSYVITDSLYKQSKCSWLVCQRTYYKAVRPLEIGQVDDFTTSITCDRFIALKSLIINSRFSPVQRNCSLDYTENLQVNLTNLSDGVIITQKFIIFNVEYNSNVYLVFDTPKMIAPDVTYSINLKWDDYYFGCEYPRCILSKIAKTNACIIEFDKHLSVENNFYCNDTGSILNGLEYCILN